MKFIASFIFLFSLSSLAQAQKPIDSILPIDESGKFIYYEVVNSKIAVDSLKIKVVNYLKKQNKDLKYLTTHDDTAFIANGKLVINKTILVMSHPSGEVEYKFQVEIRSGKYRFWLTNFIFNPYVRDRYGNFVKTTAAGIPLEFNPSKLNAAQWKEYQVQTTKYAQELATKFKIYMSSKLPTVVPPKEKTVVKKEW